MACMRPAGPGASVRLDEAARGLPGSCSLFRALVTALAGDDARGAILVDPSWF